MVEASRGFSQVRHKQKKADEIFEVYDFFGLCYILTSWQIQQFIRQEQLARL